MILLSSATPAPAVHPILSRCPKSGPTEPSPFAFYKDPSGATSVPPLANLVGHRHPGEKTEAPSAPWGPRSEDPAASPRLLLGYEAQDPLGFIFGGLPPTTLLKNPSCHPLHWFHYLVMDHTAPFENTSLID